MIGTTLAMACLFYGGYYLMFSEEDKRLKNINQVLAGKGYVKAYDRKQNLYVVGLSVGSSFNDLEKLQGALENVLKSEVELTNNNFQYCIKPIIKKVLPSLIPFKLVETSHQKGLKVAVAMGLDGLIYLDFTQVPHVLIAGATGWGKSIFLKNLIIQLINNFSSIELELFDFKSGVELSDFKNLKQTKSFIVRPSQAEEEINRIYEEIEDRFSLITTTNSKDWVSFNKKNHEKMIPKFVIIEEFTVLLAHSSDISVTLTKSLAIARAVGVFFIFTSQRFDAKIIDPKIKANIDNRVCFHTADGVNSKVILDTTGAEKLKLKGRCLISTGGEIVEGQSIYATENDVNKYVKSHLKERSEVLIERVTNNERENKKSLERLEMDNNGGVELWV